MGSIQNSKYLDTIVGGIDYNYWLSVDLSSSIGEITATARLKKTLGSDYPVDGTLSLVVNGNVAKTLNVNNLGSVELKQSYSNVEGNYTVDVVWTRNSGTYTPPSGSISASLYVDGYSNCNISLDRTIALLGDTIYYAITTGVNNNINNIKYSCLGLEGIIDYSNNSWKIDPVIFGQAFANVSSAECVITLNQRFGNPIHKRLTIKVPDNYLPTAYADFEKLNTKNNALIGGISKINVTLVASTEPLENKATITSCKLIKVTSENEQLKISDFDEDVNNRWTMNNVLPAMVGSPSYDFNLTFRVIDSRGNILDYTTENLTVTNFVPPIIKIENLTRTSSTNASIGISIIDSSICKVAEVTCKGETTDVKNELVTTEDGYVLNHIITGLIVSTQYNVTFTYQSQEMYECNQEPYTYTQLLSTMFMPMSWFDNGSKIATSFGNEAADDYIYDNVVNFSEDTYVRYMENGSPRYAKASTMVCPFPIGYVYISLSDDNPKEYYPNTEWQKISDVFLLASGKNASGDTGGEEKHKLTVSELPEHQHGQSGSTLGGDVETTTAAYSSGNYVLTNGWLRNAVTGVAGGNVAHNNMPPYLVVNMWKRTA